MASSPQTFLILSQALLLVSVVSSAYPACFNRKTPDIPSDHLFNRKQKPLIIGHRGQPRKFQENSIEGVTSLVDLGADGYEIDVYLTDAGQLVLFHDDNAKALTGIDKKIWEMSKAEIKNLKYKKVLDYGKRKYTFPNQLSVGLLEDLLNKTKNTDLFMYLEMKPGHFISNNSTRSINTGKAVAKLVTKLGLEKRAFLVSFDPLKSLAAKQENPNLVVGSFYEEQYWKENNVSYRAMKQQLKAHFPGLSTCLDALPNDRRMMDFLFEKGSIFKSINASFVDMQYTIYDNKQFSNNTFKTLRDNYNKKISAGAWTIYSMKLNEKETEATEAQVAHLIKEGAGRLITDDVARLRKKLGRKSAANVKEVSVGFLLLASMIAIFCKIN